MATAIYDPAARGYLTDATPPERRGEAFGLYGAAQMGGLLLGPAIGAFGADWFGGIAFVFVFSAVAAVLAAIPIACGSRDRGADASGAGGRRDRVPAGRAVDHAAGRRRRRRRSRRAPASRRRRPPTRLLNRGLIAALIINVGGYFAGGTYEVIWSLFLQQPRGRPGPDRAHLRDVRVADPAPLAVRRPDRRSARRARFIVIGSILPAIIGPRTRGSADPALAVPLILVEATGFALLNPALYAVVAANSPVGRSSTAQGLFGAAGTVGFIVASLVAGVLAADDILYPMYVFSAVLVASLVLGLVIGGRRLGGRPVAPRRRRCAPLLSLSTAARGSGRTLPPARPCQADRVLPGLVAAMERHLELKRPAADRPPADLALGLKAASWVLKRLAIEPRLDAGSGFEHHDRMEVDLADRTL